MSEMPIIDPLRSQAPKVDILKIRKLLENNYNVNHDMAEGIAEAIDVALKDQNLSEVYATKLDLKLVDIKIDIVIEKIDALTEVMNAKFEAMDDKFLGKFEAMDDKFLGKFEAMDDKFSGKFEAMDDKFSGKFEAMDDKFSGKFESLKHQISSSQKTTVILLGSIMGGGIISIVGFLLIILIKYMPVIAKLVEMAGK